MRNRFTPRRWDETKDAEACVQCGRPFKPSDEVITDIAVNVHDYCVLEYFLESERG